MRLARGNPNVSVRGIDQAVQYKEEYAHGFEQPVQSGYKEKQEKWYADVLSLKARRHE